MDAGSVIVAASEKGLSKWTMTDWTAQLIRQKIQPTKENFLKFLKNKAEEMDEDDHPSRPPVTKQQTTPQRKPYWVPVFHTREMVGCKLCGDNHALFQCPDFRNQTVDQRQATTQCLKACGNCLGIDHSTRDCISKRSCRTCGGRHHSLLHHTGFSQPSNSYHQQQMTTSQQPVSSTHHVQSNAPITHVARIATNNFSSTTTEATCITAAGSLASILGTCLATLEHQGRLYKASGLVDNGSSVSFISA